MNCQAKGCNEKAIGFQWIMDGQTPNAAMFKVAVCETHKNPSHEFFPLTKA
jgi:hypothetical protein